MTHDHLDDLRATGYPAPDRLQLQRPIPHEHAIELVATLRTQRDELLAALEQIFQHAYDDDSSIESIMGDFDNMREIARAAIAAASGQ